MDIFARRLQLYTSTGTKYVGLCLSLGVCWYSGFQYVGYSGVIFARAKINFYCLYYVTVLQAHH